MAANYLKDFYDKNILGTSFSKRSDFLSLWLFGQRGRQRTPKVNSQPFVSRHSIDMEQGSPTSNCTYSMPWLQLYIRVHKKHRTPSDSIKTGTKLDVLISPYISITKSCSHYIPFSHGNNRAQSNMEEWLRGAKRNSNMESPRHQSHGGRRKVTLRGTSI